MGWRGQEVRKASRNRWSSGKTLKEDHDQTGLEDKTAEKPRRNTDLNEGVEGNINSRVSCV